MDHVNAISKLVSETFKNLTITDIPSTSTTNQLFTGFLKILGFDERKIWAIAINGLLFLAQLLGTSLMPKSLSDRPDQVEDINAQSPFDWILENDKVAELVSYVSDRNLPEHVIEYVREKSPDEQSGCVQLLLCNVAPFMWEMQRVLISMKNGTNIGDERYLPAREEIVRQNQMCEKRYQFCH